jgi:4-hydroxy-3-methylbut-2-enyl diphosphate reductase
VTTVERALDRFGTVYVRKQIVHNRHVVAELEARGAIFVDELDQVPDGATVVFSAHGVAPVVRLEAERRGLRVIDASCPLVTKVHHEARRLAETGWEILLIGHAGHEEVVGTFGEAPAAMTLVESLADADRVEPRQTERLAWLSQTTLSVDETRRIVDRLRQRFPAIQDPPRDDICYATSNRQAAVAAVAADIDLMIVVGSDNSSNSKRLVEVALTAGAGAAQLIDDASGLEPAWLTGVSTVGLTSGASAPQRLVSGVIEALADLGFSDVEPYTAAVETLTFSLPAAVR